ncbi:MAG: CocE/NonD family hydrolase [Rhizomicrobium sp.]
MGKWWKRTFLGLLSLSLLAGAVTTIKVARASLPGEEMTPAGFRQNTSVYVKMRDGVEIAVTVWLPADLKQGERVPVLMRETRYWRAPKLEWGLRALVAANAVDAKALQDRQRAFFNTRHFAVILVDARGSGASGGHRAMEYSPAEIADLGEVATWASTQPWSSGRVGTFGESYDGNTAELAAVPNQKAIGAVMPLYDDFDTEELVQPGGVALTGFVQRWSDTVAALDRNDVCAVQGVQGWACWKTRQIISGVRPVDADSDGEHLAALVKQRHNVNVAQALGGTEFRDDAISTPEGVFRFQDISPYGWRKQIEVSGVPMMVWCGWLDANPCEGTLIRYRTFSNPQTVVIGPLSHGGNFNVDPIASAHSPAVPPSEEQFKMEADFFDQALRSPQNIESSILYYTMGEGAWHKTKVWPPAGLTTQRLYFADDHSLSETAPVAGAKADTYAVDYTASSGSQTRWHTQLGGGDVIYPDRAAEDKKLLTYTSAPLDADMEITGSPILTLQISSTASDGAVHAYLEDVSPAGRVTYLDEGVLRMIDRKEVDAKSLPYQPLGPAHSFLRADAEPMISGQAAAIRLSLLPTSILLRQGHRIRIALAGADANLFQRIPASGPLTWTVYREAERASFIELPAAKRQ